MKKTFNASFLINILIGITAMALLIYFTPSCKPAQSEIVSESDVHDVKIIEINPNIKVITFKYQLSKYIVVRDVNGIAIIKHS
jgi:hypothetical protein